MGDSGEERELEREWGIVERGKSMKEERGHYI